MNSSFNSFLIINPYGIGDVLFSSPVLANLHESFPQATLYYLCNKRTYPVIISNPLIEEAFIYERDDFETLRHTSGVRWAKAYWKFIQDIKKKHIDVAIDLSLNSQFGFFAWAAGIKKRIGLDYKHRGRFLTDKVPIDGYEGKHVVEFYLDVLKPMGIQAKHYPLQVFADSGAKQWAEQFIGKNNLAGHLLIGIAPCGGQAFGPQAHLKRWPLENFVKLTQKLIETFNARIFFFAGRGEKDQINRIIQSLRENSVYCYEFTDTGLRELIGIIEYCDIVVANDTGPLRFADALGKKLVALFGPVDEVAYGPYPFDKKRVAVMTKEVPCRPCYRKFRLPHCAYGKRCLTGIGTDEVFNAVKKLLTDIEN